MKSGRAKRWLAKNREGNLKRKRLNADLWQRLLDARDKHDIKFIWVKHASTPENIRCNKLAEAATLESDLLKDSGYKIYRKTQDPNKERNDISYAKFLERLDEIDTALKQGQRVDKIKFRTHLKHSHTEAEQLMWKYLKNSSLRKGQKGLKFVQQMPVGPYFADFYCRRARLVVEIDGTIHTGQIEYDKRRDDFMTGRGFLVLRYKNEEVLADIQSVLSKIYAIAIERRTVSTYKR
jgi:very-short-patch-repair endonuclease